MTGKVDKIASDAITILLKGWLELRPEMLHSILGSSNTETRLDLEKGEGINTLGLQWNTVADSHQYPLSEASITENY